MNHKVVVLLWIIVNQLPEMTKFCQIFHWWCFLILIHLSQSICQLSSVWIFNEFFNEIFLLKIYILQFLINFSRPFSVRFKRLAYINIIYYQIKMVHKFERFVCKIRNYKIQNYINEINIIMTIIYNNNNNNNNNNNK